MVGCARTRFFLELTSQQGYIATNGQIHDSRSTRSRRTPG